MNLQKIGFIGMGIMGAPMVENLLESGYDVIVHSRTKAKAEPVIEAGARWAESPAECAENADVVITCVTDTPDVRKVLLGQGGVIESAKAGLICVDMSTISPAATQEMSGILSEKGIVLIDAPVSGGEIGAIEAKLSIMMGGPEEAVKKVMPVMEAMGRTIVHCGPSGYGQMTKLVNQVMVVHTVMSIAEGFALAEKMGLNLETTLKVTAAGAAGSNSLKALGPKIIAGDMKPAFMVDLQMKDLRLVMEYAEKLKQPLPGAALIKQLMTALQAQGRGRDGTQSLVDVIRQLGKS
jgi:3-hydroxyisobutyrate dehydrogenase